MKKKFLCVFLVLAMALTCGCQSNAGGSRSDDTEPNTEATETEKDEAPENAVPDADAADAAAETANDEAADAPAAGEWVWIEEPAYLYDDVEPIWARDFSDVGGMDSPCSSWLPLLSNEDFELFCEMSFPQYSCLPQYYRVLNGSSGRLFYMPDHMDSGTLTAAWASNNLYIFDGSILFYGENGEMPPWPQPDSPWDVLGSLERGAGSASLLYEDDDARLEGFLAGAALSASVRDIKLHKPYAIQRAETDTSDSYAFVAPDGSLITDFIYDEVGSFSDGIAAVCQDGRWGYIDDKGQSVTALTYDAPWDTLTVVYSDDFSSRPYVIAYPCTCDTMVVRQNGGTGLLYRDGSVLIDFGEFEDMAPAWNNELWVKQDGKWGLLDLAAVKKAAGHPEWEISQPYDEAAIAELRAENENALLDHWFRDMEVRPKELLDTPGSAQVTAEPSLIMRKGPGKEYDRITTIPQGYGVSIASEEENGWVVVSTGTRYGWVNTDYLE